MHPSVASRHRFDREIQMTITNHRFTVLRQDGIGPHPDDLECAICGSPKLEHQLGKYATGVAGVYSGGVLWGVRKSDSGEEPVVMQTGKSEDVAREWLSHFHQLWETHPRRDEIHEPELVAARIHWQVQE